MGPDFCYKIRTSLALLFTLRIVSVIRTGFEGPPFEGEAATGSRLSVYPSSVPRLNLTLGLSTLRSGAEPLSLPADYGIGFRPFFSQAFVDPFAAEFAIGFALSPIQASPDSRIDGIPDVMPIGSGTNEGLSNRLAGPDAISVSQTEVLCHAS